MANTGGGNRQKRPKIAQGDARKIRIKDIVIPALKRPHSRQPCVRWGPTCVPFTPRTAARWANLHPAVGNYVHQILT
ncbi:hypothetical protein [Nitrosomonas sp. Nm33]|uniref:hypothetical protein n=1 Tax=Nitrosomonas sp. Nm33 TaxID=133724 RepID=UPI00115FFBE4|nr:hypothetical protein [Nitrosomonas sp. Nm33]